MFLIGVAAALLVGCSTPPKRPETPASATVAAALTVSTYAATNAALPTLARLAAAAGTADPWAGAGPFTVFAPSDAAFARLAPGTVEALLKVENRPVLVRLLGYHAIAGTLTAADLTARVTAGNGQAILVTLAGDPLTLSVTEGHLTLADADGNKSYVETGDLRQSNGIVHVVNGVLVPKPD
ncbi:fasciclin domain-containing protein [Sphingomonas sp.]|uniref:fasciclin domain-containing protein n=1 Tax=Sphingomonas sp. TaxID=28214 RepID=UPI002D7FEDC8|nr:fasciclin domain-containing protein [Sphingomonas sp.]HEU0044155.1 fasciclin domain-containing protein [Sphingomonas sp.]